MTGRPGPRTRYVVVIDGEHYPPVVVAALRDIRAAGGDVVGAVLAGGKEKLPASGAADLGGVPVSSGGDPRVLLERALVRWTPDAVIDLSDEPVLDYRARHQLAAVALHMGVPYQGADFRFEPPPRPNLCAKPSIAVAGTGKRTGKTAVAGFAARRLVEIGRRPVVVAMGRGGPPQPEVLRGDRIDLQPKDLLALADAGKHAASDYVEDALLARVATVGCRRCGGGIAGGVEHSNVAEGIAMANRLEADLILLEGSGAALPPARADVTGLIVPASIPPEYLAGYMGPYRLLLADFVVVTMCEEPFGSPSQVSAISQVAGDAYRGGVAADTAEEIKVVRTVFRPSPLRTVEGANVYVATTAPAPVGERMKRHLESEHGCKVAGISHSLADRSALQEEVGRGIEGADVLLCEIKAAAVDVATRLALDAGREVVYMDNIPVGISEDDDLNGVLDGAAALADKRFRELDRA